MIDFASLRQRMVREQIQRRGVKNEGVLKVMGELPRHLFVEESFRKKAYDNNPLPIGYGQTISQPYMVALMTELMELKGTEKVLEIGTGSGYETAVLSRMAGAVFTVERVKSLGAAARKLLCSLGISNVSFAVSDGTCGWEEEAPFDGVIVTAGSPKLPECYADQLKPGGRIVIPVGDETNQTLYRYRKSGDTMSEERITRCVFVKLIGKHGWSDGEA